MPGVVALGLFPISGRSSSWPYDPATSAADCKVPSQRRTNLRKCSCPRWLRKGPADPTRAGPAGRRQESTSKPPWLNATRLVPCHSDLGQRTLFILCPGGPFGNLAQCCLWHRMPHEPEDTAAKKGSGTFCRNGPEGASHKRCLTPF